MNQFTLLPADMIREIAMKCSYNDFFALYKTSKFIRQIINPHTVRQFIDKYTTYYDGYKIININNKLYCINDEIKVWCYYISDVDKLKNGKKSNFGSLTIGIKGVYFSICCLYDKNGNFIGVLSRDDGPAFIKDDEYRWYFQGVPHNIYGPAVITKDIKKWYKYGELHRIGGPAVEHANGVVEYWINGVPYDSSEYKK